MYSVFAISLLLSVTASSAFGDFWSPSSYGIDRLGDHAEQIVFDTHKTRLPPLNTTYYFNQLIDHNNPGLGTFKQRYWHTWEFYKNGELLRTAIYPSH